MPQTRSSVTVDPSKIGTASVRVTTPAGTDVPAYTTANGSTAVTWPDEITTPTTFHLTTDGDFLVSVKVNGVEVANGNGGVLRGGNGHLTVAPSLNTIAELAAGIVTQAPLTGAFAGLGGDNVATATGSVQGVEDLPTASRDRTPEFLRLKWKSAIRSLGRDGTTNFHLMSMPDVAAIDGGTLDWMMIGDHRMVCVSVSADLDLIGNDIIDVTNIGNTVGSYNTRLVQARLAADGGTAYDVGIATMNAAGVLTDRLVVTNALANGYHYVRITPTTNFTVRSGSLTVGDDPDVSGSTQKRVTITTDSGNSWVNIQAEQGGVAYWPIRINPSGGDVRIAAAGGKVGFFGNTGAVKQTGVAVTAQGIHDALVAYGLIAA